MSLFGCSVDIQIHINISRSKLCYILPISPILLSALESCPTVTDSLSRLRITWEENLNEILCWPTGLSLGYCLT